MRTTSTAHARSFDTQGERNWAAHEPAGRPTPNAVPATGPYAVVPQAPGPAGRRVEDLLRAHAGIVHELD